MTLFAVPRLRLWLLLDLLLATLVAVQVQPPNPVTANLPFPTLPEGAAAPEATLPPLDVLGQTISRPLFAPDRKPAPDRAAAPATAWKGEFKLTGIILTPGSRMAVVVRGDKPGPALRLVEGAQVDGWRVMAIRPSGVTFGRDGEQHEVTLQDKKAQEPKR